MIFYFTATGNCLYAARQLDKNTMSIPQVMSSNMTRFSDDSMGVVYPVFGHRPPEMVREFLERVELYTPYLYIIPTYGARHANAVEIVSDICKKAGKRPAYIHTLLMVDNYLPAFDMDAQRMLDKRVDAQIGEIKADIAARRKYIEPVTDDDRAAHANFLKYEAVLPGRSLSGLVYASDRCIGCGICARVCPGGCIRIVEGKAHFDYDNCQGCLACAHACTQKAIELKIPEVNPSARYRNEHVTLQDIIYANNQTR